MAGFSANISVSQYNFLQFDSSKDLDDYWLFLLGSTHAEVQDYLSSINFTSLGNTLYGEDYWNDMVTEDEAVNYIFNEDKIFQVEDVVMKPINEVTAEVKWQFLLTMTVQHLSGLSYENMASGSYDGNTMNKFATNPASDSLDLFDFIANNPTGYEETTANSPQARRPMFGRDETNSLECGGAYLDGTNNCVKGCQEVITPTTYIFWIGFPRKPRIGNSYTMPAEGC